jgi:hypothetical protein
VPEPENAALMPMADLSSAVSVTPHESSHAAASSITGKSTTRKLPPRGSLIRTEIIRGCDPGNVPRGRFAPRSTQFPDEKSRMETAFGVAAQASAKIHERNVSFS